MAHRSYHGIEDRQTATGGRMLRRDRWRADVVHGIVFRHPGEHHAHDHRRDRGSWIYTPNERGALGSGTTDRVGMDLDYSRFSAGGSYRLSIDAEHPACFVTIPQ